mmetsp:Transcript_23868/g.35275  ORF Transcript_23868/g.35275 Transcript_23868/m.35275 type:complete len:247 (+) Transcript_23868:443-1183(+)
MIFCNDTFHTKSTMNTLLLIWINQIQIIAFARIAWLEKSQLIKEILRTAFITMSLLHSTAANQSIIPMWIIRAQFIIGHIGMLEPFIVGHAHIFCRFRPILRCFNVITITTMLISRVLSFESLGMPLCCRRSPARLLPIHEVIVRRILRSMGHFIHQTFHIVSSIPSFHRGSDRRVSPYDKGQLLSAIRHCLVKIPFKIKNAQALMNFVFGRRSWIIRWPMSQDLHDGPCIGIIWWWFVGTIVYIV